MEEFLTGCLVCPGALGDPCWESQQTAIQQPLAHEMGNTLHHTYRKPWHSSLRSSPVSLIPPGYDVMSMVSIFPLMKYLLWAFSLSSYRFEMYLENIHQIHHKAKTTNRMKINSYFTQGDTFPASEEHEVLHQRMTQHEMEHLYRKKDDVEVNVFSKCGNLLIFSASGKLSNRPGICIGRKLLLNTSLMRTYWTIVINWPEQSGSHMSRNKKQSNGMTCISNKLTQQPHKLLHISWV